MISWTYTKGSLVGFLIGFLLFLLVSPLTTLVYQDQMWLLVGCIGAGIAIGCATVRQVNRFFERQARR
jgi:hypothetical protein